MDRPYIVGLGEVLWDLFPEGARFGGAPANFACASAQLAPAPYKVAIVSAVGNDELGRQAINELSQRGVETGFVGVNENPTGQVHVHLDASGSASYEIATGAAWDALSWTDDLGELAESTAAVCFGTLGQRAANSRSVVRRFLAQTPPYCERIFDINLRPPHWSEEVILEALEFADIIKCNEDELPVLAALCDCSPSSDTLLPQLCDTFDVDTIVATRGDEGSTVYSSFGETSHCQAVQTSVVDTVGAGDAFTAAIAVGQLHGFPLDDVHAWASRVAAFVCSQKGATPTIPEALRSGKQSTS